jgi:hypothetical protein
MKIRTKRERAGTLELKGEGQGFTLRRYAIVLQKPITRAIEAHNCSKRAGLRDCSSTARSLDNYTKECKKRTYDKQRAFSILLTVSIHFSLPKRQVFTVLF